jgi:hypothetical protein
MIASPPARQVLCLRSHSQLFPRAALKSMGGSDRYSTSTVQITRPFGDTLAVST